MTLRRFNDSLARVLDERRKVDAELRPGRVEARNDDGTLRFRPLHGECVQTAPQCGLYVGQIVENPCSAPFKHLGAAGISMVRRSRAAAAMAVTSLTPDLFDRGFAGDVTVTGLGFTPVSEFNFLLPGTEDINPGVTISASVYVSATEFTLTVAVAADAEVVPEGTGDIAFDNPGLALF